MNVYASWQLRRREREGGPRPGDNDLVGGMPFSQRPPNEGLVLRCAAALDQMMEGCTNEATSGLDALPMHEGFDGSLDDGAGERKTNPRGFPPTL